MPYTEWTLVEGPMHHPPDEWRRVWERHYTPEGGGAPQQEQTETFCGHEIPPECPCKPPA